MKFDYDLPKYNFRYDSKPKFEPILDKPIYNNGSLVGKTDFSGNVWSNTGELLNVRLNRTTDVFETPAGPSNVQLRGSSCAPRSFDYHFNSLPSYHQPFTPALPSSFQPVTLPSMPIFGHHP